MRDLSRLTNQNDRATIREYQDALETGNVTLAGRIALANPDLFPGRTPTMRVQSQRETYKCRACGASIGDLERIAAGLFMDLCPPCLASARQTVRETSA